VTRECGGHLLEIKSVDSKVNVHIFSFNKYPIYTHKGASAKFSTNSHETDNSVAEKNTLKLIEKKGYAGIFWQCKKVLISITH
jgi:hypothetical protein